jgi:two-component system chemotaxis response regulator CheB
MTSPPNDNGSVRDNSGFAGTLRNIQITDIIQMCCLAGASLCIRVSQDSDLGTIHIQDGEVVHAEFGSQTGVQAFFTILGWQSGQFETLESPAIAAPTIKEPCQFLLMEAARQADEMAQTRQERPQGEKLQRLRVLIVDDSPIMSKILTSMLTADAGIEVVGTAENGEEALTKMKQLSPDLITMDVNMPVMDGSTALKHIMIGSPCPVLIMSNLLPSSYSTLLSFLNLGAVDFMSKPVKSSNILLQQQRIVDRVHIAAKAKVGRFHLLRCPKLKPSDYLIVSETEPCEKLVIVYSGTGGYLEMVHFITAMPADAKSGLLSLQSIPPKFARTLSSYLNLRCRFDIRPLYGDVQLNPGQCYIGTGGRDYAFSIVDGQLGLKDRSDGQQVNEKDNTDRLFASAAELFQDRTTVVLLSGAELGSLEGLRSVKQAGGTVLSPRLEECILPASIQPAVDAGLISEMFSPSEIKAVLARYCT